MANKRDYDKLHTGFAELILMLVLKVKEAGHDIKIAQEVRSVEEQNRLYAIGRTKTGLRVTNAKGGDSMHNYNLAVDFCLVNDVIERGRRTRYPSWHPVWKAIGEAAKELGLEWGGDWKTIKDRPHVQLPVALKTVKSLYASGGLSAVFDYADEVVKDLKAKYKPEPIKLAPATPLKTSDAAAAIGRYNVNTDGEGGSHHKTENAATGDSVENRTM